MKDPSKIPSDALVKAGLDLLIQTGRPLTKLPSRGRAMIYGMTDGRTVRLRTCNDPVLVIVADSDTDDAKLSVEGTDFVYIVMPELPRTPGPVVGYLVPTNVVVDAARSTHKRWRESNPNTSGNNRTWNLWFGADGPAKANNYAEVWRTYRVEAAAAVPPATSPVAEPGQKLADVIASARQKIADAAGIAPEQVKITIEIS